MANGKRFEDYISVEDLMKKPQKELMAQIYVQTLKTNGTISLHCQQIDEIHADLKTKASSIDLEDIRRDLKDKIGQKIFVILASILGVVMVIFNIWDRLIQ